MIHPSTTAFPLMGSLGAIQKIKQKSDSPISLVDFFIANCSANVAKDLHSIESDSANCVTHVFLIILLSMLEPKERIFL